MITGSPFTLKDTSLTLKVGSDTAQEYRAQLTEATLTPSDAGSGNELTTFVDTYSDNSGDSTWELTLAGFQSFKEANDFSMWAFDNEGEKADFVLLPGQGGSTISATNPGFSGKVTVKPTVIGGTAKTYAVFSVSLKCEAKPVKVTAAQFAAAE